MKLWEVHPAIVHFPIAFLLAAVAVDLWSVRRPREVLVRSAAGLYVAGVLSGILAAVAGVAAWLTAPHDASVHTAMIWHPVFAASSLALFTLVARWRWKGRTRPPAPLERAAAVAAAGLLLVAASLGGHLVFRGGAGVTAPREGTRPPPVERVLEERPRHERHGP